MVPVPEGLDLDSEFVQLEEPRQAEAEDKSEGFSPTTHSPETTVDKVNIPDLGGRGRKKIHVCIPFGLAPRFPQTPRHSSSCLQVLTMSPEELAESEAAARKQLESHRATHSAFYLAGKSSASSADREEAEKPLGSPDDKSSSQASSSSGGGDALRSPPAVSRRSSKKVHILKEESLPPNAMQVGGSRKVCEENPAQPPPDAAAIVVISFFPLTVLFPRGCCPSVCGRGRRRHVH